MKWRKLPGYLKGGIILSVISLILLLVYYFYFNFMIMQFGETIFYILFPISTLGILGLSMCGDSCASGFTQGLLVIVFALMNIALYFLIGAIIGWICDKIVNKKNMKVKNGKK